jgi:hypothetical protein
MKDSPWLSGCACTALIVLLAPPRLFSISTAKRGTSGTTVVFGYNKRHNRNLCLHPCGPDGASWPATEGLACQLLVPSLDYDRREKDNKPEKPLWIKLEDQVVFINIHIILYIFLEERRN